MKVRLVFVPPGGGEADYSLDFEMPAIPRPGDYISVMRPGDDGTSDFIVRRTWWTMDFPNNDLYGDSKNPVYGTVQQIAVECEFALGNYSGSAHKQSCEAYRNRKGGIQEFEASAY